MTQESPPPMNPPAQAPVPNEDERNMAMLCHLLGIVASYTIGLGFVGPLIIWVLKKDSSVFVDFHGKEAINFQLSMLIYLVALGSVTFITMFFFVGILLIPVIIVVAVLALIAEIIACVAASRGEWHRYPACIRFLK